VYPVLSVPCWHLGGSSVTPEHPLSLWSLQLAARLRPGQIPLSPDHPLERTRSSGHARAFQDLDGFSLVGSLPGDPLGGETLMGELPDPDVAPFGARIRISELSLVMWHLGWRHIIQMDSVVGILGADECPLRSYLRTSRPPEPRITSPVFHTALSALELFL
jgi:hypothetical protein